MKGTICAANFNIIALKFPWRCFVLFSLRQPWKLIHCGGLVKHFFFSVCKWEATKDRVRQTRTTPEGFDVGQCMWAKPWEPEPPPAHQFNLQFTDYNSTPHIYSTWVGGSHLHMLPLLEYYYVPLPAMAWRQIIVLILMFKVQISVNMKWYISVQKQ